MMEEQILKIMIPEFAHLNMVQASKTAEKIADHFREFIEWQIIGDHDFGMQFNSKPPLFVNFSEGSKHKYTLDELYQYWNNEIKITKT